MSGREPGGGRGPGDGYFGPGNDGPGTTTPSIAASTPGGSSSGGSNLPVWALVLIMVGSGLITLTFLWLCVLFICRKRRTRRAAVRDLETAVQNSFQSERETARMLGHSGIDRKEEDAKRCEAEAGVELTFVVMAGEDQPSYLAKPAPQKTTNLTSAISAAAAAAGDAKTPGQEANLQLEKQTQQRGAPASETPPGNGVVVDVAGAHDEQPVIIDQKTPPSPS